MHSHKKRPPASDTEENWEANSSAKTRKVPRRKTGPSSPTPPSPAPNHSQQQTTTRVSIPANITQDHPQEGKITSPAIQTRTFISSQHPELSIAVPTDLISNPQKDDEGLSAADAVAAVAAAAALSNANQHYTPTEHLGHYHPQNEHELGHQHYEDDQREFDPSVIAVHALHQQLQQHHLQQLQQQDENQGHHRHELLEQGHDVSDGHLHHHQLHDVSDSGDSRMFRSEHSQDRDDHGAAGSGDGGTGSDGGQYKRSRGRGPSHALRNLSMDERRDRRLQRNRVAAKECRNKKKAYIMTLEEKCAGLEEENIRLLKQVDELNAKFTLGTMRRLVNTSNGSNFFNNNTNQSETNTDPTAAVPHPAPHAHISDMAHAAAAVAQAAGLDFQTLGAQLEAVAAAGVSSESGSVEGPSSETELRVNHTEPAPSSTTQPSHTRQNESSQAQTQSPVKKQPKVACA